MLCARSCKRDGYGWFRLQRWQRASTNWPNLPPRQLHAVAHQQASEQAHAGVSLVVWIQRRWLMAACPMRACAFDATKCLAHAQPVMRGSGWRELRWLCKLRATVAVQAGVGSRPEASSQPGGR